MFTRVGTRNIVCLLCIRHYEVYGCELYVYTALDIMKSTVVVSCIFTQHKTYEVLVVVTYKHLFSK